MNLRFASLIIVAALLTCLGCSDGLVKVQGVVLLDDQPLPNADIMLMPDAGGRPVNGKSDASGKFQLTTNAPNDGVEPGTYKVSVTAFKPEYEARAGAEEGYIEKQKWIAPQKFSDPATSGLKVTVKLGEPKMVLLLKSAQP